MKEKEIRAQQAEKLKSGIHSGTYYLTVTAYDGRQIIRKDFETEEELEKVYQQAVDAWRQGATVRKSIEFLI